jgi:periplasmic protein CpxP/Spy
MKRNRIALLLAICMNSILALAQYGGQGHRHQMPSVDDQVNRLSENLNLSDSQKTQARTILQDQRDKMSALRQDTSLSREDRHSKMMEIHQTTAGQIRGLLNEDQQKKYDAMEQERQQEMQSHGHGSGDMEDNH